MLINLHTEKASDQIWWVGFGINDDGDADDDDSESSLDVRRLVMIAPNPDRERVSIRSFGNHVPFSIAIPVGLYSNP